VQAAKEIADKRFKAVEAAERDWLEKAKANAKETGEARAAEDLQAFADKFSKDAKGTTIDILKRLAALPRAKLISTLTDLGGEETARSVAVLVGQLGNLEAAMAIAEDTAGNAGSKQKEYAARTETTANQLQLLNNKLQALQIAIGDSGLEGLGKAAKFLGELADGAAKFAENNPGLTTALVAIGGVASALVIAAPGILAAITLVGKIGTALGAVNLGGLIAGWMPAVVGTLAKLGGLFVIFAQGIILALGTVITWLGSTFLPAVVAFFSGPVGWTVLAIAAVVAMAIAFREPLMDFLAWLWEWGEPIRKFWVDLWNGLPQAVSDAFAAIDRVIVQADQAIQRSINNTWQAISSNFQKYVTEPISKGWTAVAEALPKVMQAAANFVGRVWTGVINSIRGAVRGLLLFIANAVNSVVNVINNLIDAFNNVASATNAPLRLSRLNPITVPAFAEGGYVNRPTVGLVGEAGPEYIIPQSKMQAASERFLAGQRGANVLRPYKNVSRNTTTPGASLPQINITTGPVLEFNGERYVTVRDFEKGMRMTAEGVIGRLRTPAARIALGR
jgi:hypothetical protein